MWLFISFLVKVCFCQVNNIKTVACVDQSLVAIYFIPTKTRVLDVGKPKPNSTCIPLYSWLLSFGWVVYYHLTISVVEAALIKCNKQWLLDMDSVVVIYFGWLAMWCSVLLFIPFCGFG
ncbi:hypothetical protein QVD17_35602 [Tagetes erecta]|uniref:Uncharacterized protein n=1 Tax=Tagetes erecta TaxID=13708 RepID=A0AAD8JUQ5_TARER|nr:hypothetical protein QVD17_35602 [Tagetes erecta]